MHQLLATFDNADLLAATIGNPSTRSIGTFDPVKFVQRLWLRITATTPARGAGATQHFVHGLAALLNNIRITHPNLPLMSINVDGQTLIALWIKRYASLPAVSQTIGAADLAFDVYVPIDLTPQKTPSAEKTYRKRGASWNGMNVTVTLANPFSDTDLQTNPATLAIQPVQLWAEYAWEGEAQSTSGAPVIERYGNFEGDYLRVNDMFLSQCLLQSRNIGVDYISLSAKAAGMEIYSQADPDGLDAVGCSHLIYNDRGGTIAKGAGNELIQNLDMPLIGAPPIAFCDLLDDRNYKIANPPYQFHLQNRATATPLPYILSGWRV